MTVRRMTAILLAAIGLWSVNAARAEEVHLDFDTGMVSRFEPRNLNGSSYGRVELQTNRFCEGINGGRALDLSSRAAVRIPLLLENAVNYDESFSVALYVKTLPEAAQGTAIAGNCRYEEAAGTPGWLIYAQENGAWAVRFSDGRKTYFYRPTARQAINDGRFHQLAFSVDYANECVRFYRDGVCRAIYRTPDLGSLAAGQTVIGGSADQEYFGQEYAFNGMLDEVRLCQQPLTDAAMRTEFETCFPDRAAAEPRNRTGRLRLLEWNIWSAGKNFGRKVGLERTIEILRAADPDIVGLVETYGHGAELADALDCQLYLIGDNLSILSRYPIEQVIRIYDPVLSGGAIIRLDDKRKIAVFDLWLHYLPDYLGSITGGEKKTAAELIRDEEPTRHAEIKQILAELEPFLAGADTVPVIMMGDFNGGSHLDWTTDNTAPHQGYAVEWPVSKTMQQHELVDSYRLLNPNIHTSPGATWSPWMIPGRYDVDRQTLPDRVDYIYFKGALLRPLHSQVIDYHPVMFPSDHAALLTDFAWVETAEPEGGAQ